LADQNFREGSNIMNIDREIKELVTPIIGRDATGLDETASFANDLGVDSLMILEILAAIENKYNLEISPERLAEMQTLQGVVAVAREYLAGDRENA
jgi:acyl carrier protein